MTELPQEKGTLNFTLPSFITPGISAGSLKRKEQNKFKKGSGFVFLFVCCAKYDQLELSRKGEPNDLALWPKTRLYQTRAGLTQVKTGGLVHNRFRSAMWSPN